MNELKIHPKESIKVGQVYRSGNGRIEVVGMKGNVPVCRMYGVTFVPEGYEYTPSFGIGENWELDQPSTPAVLGTHQSVRYAIIPKNTEFDVVNFVDEFDSYLSTYDTVEEAKEDDFDAKFEVIVKVTVDYKVEEVSEPKPTFESELAELKKKYGKE